MTIATRAGGTVRYLYILDQSEYERLSEQGSTVFYVAGLNTEKINIETAGLDLATVDATPLH